MSSSINWVGNRVLDPGTRPYRQTTISIPTQQDSSAEPLMPAMSTPTLSPSPTPTLSSAPTLSLAPAPTLSQAPMPVQQVSPTVPETQQGPPPASEKGYIPNYLRSNIGKNIRAEFIIGMDQFTDRTGILTEVGNNYFVIHDVNSRTDIMCDLYSVKFVTILTE